MVAKKFIYRGVYSQRGQGIGSVLGSIFRTLVPALSSGAKAIATSPTTKKVLTAVGKEALKTGSETIADIAKGKQVKEAVNANVGAAKKRLAEAVSSGQGHCSPKKRSKGKGKGKGKKTKANSSLFGMDD